MKDTSKKHHKKSSNPAAHWSEHCSIDEIHKTHHSLEREKAPWEFQELVHIKFPDEWQSWCLENKLRCCPQQLESFCGFAIKSAYAIKIKRLCHKKSSAHAIKNIGTLWNFTKHLHQNPPEPHKVSVPEPHQASSPPKLSGTSQGLCTGTFRNLAKYLPRNPPEPHHASSPRPSGTSSGRCTGNFRNLTRYLHRNPPEPHRTLRSLSRYLHLTRYPHRSLRNLTRYLHQNPPEPCLEPGVEQSFAVGGKKDHRFGLVSKGGNIPKWQFIYRDTLKWCSTMRSWGVPNFWIS